MLIYDAKKAVNKPSSNEILSKIKTELASGHVDIHSLGENSIEILYDYLNTLAEKNDKKITKKIDSLTEDEMKKYFKNEYDTYKCVGTSKFKEFKDLMLNGLKNSDFSFPEKDESANVYYYGNKEKAFVIMSDIKHDVDKHERIIVTGYDGDGIRFSICNNKKNKSEGTQKVFKSRHEYLIKGNIIRKIEHDNPDATDHDEDAIVKNNKKKKRGNVYTLASDPNIKSDYSKKLIIPDRNNNTANIYLVTKKGIPLDKLHEYADLSIDPIDVLQKIFQKYHKTISNENRIIDMKSGNILLLIKHTKLNTNVDFDVRFFDRGYIREGAVLTTYVPILKSIDPANALNSIEQTYNNNKDNTLKSIYDMPGILECTLNLTITQKTPKSPLLKLWDVRCNI